MSSTTASAMEMRRKVYGILWERAITVFEVRSEELFVYARREYDKRGRGGLCLIYDSLSLAMVKPPREDKIHYISTSQMDNMHNDDVFQPFYTDVQKYDPTTMFVCWISITISMSMRNKNKDNDALMLSKIVYRYVQRLYRPLGYVPGPCRDVTGDQAKRRRQSEKCAMCLVKDANTKLKICNGCATARYCGKKCQRAHWCTHKLVCREWAGVKRSVKKQLKRGPMDVDVTHGTFLQNTLYLPM
jgi:hypothetical protein